MWLLKRKKSPTKARRCRLARRAFPSEARVSGQTGVVPGFQKTKRISSGRAGPRGRTEGERPEARDAALACDSGVSAAQDGRNLDTNEGMRTHLQRALAVGDHEDLRLIMAVSLPPSQPHTISLLANSS